MTIKEINELTTEGREFLLAERLLDISGQENNWSHPDTEELDGDGNPLKDYSFASAVLDPEKGVKPSQQDLEDELVVYKAELTVIENARLAEIARKEDLKSRFAALYDKRMAMDGQDIANPAAYFRDEILNIEDKALAEQRLAACENASEAFRVSYEAAQVAIPMDDMKAERNVALTATDFTQLADAPLTSAEKAEYRTYRQHLRDLPEKVENQQKLDYVVPTFEEFKNGAI